MLLNTVALKPKLPCSILHVCCNTCGAVCATRMSWLAALGTASSMCYSHHPLSSTLPGSLSHTLSCFCCLLPLAPLQELVLPSSPVLDYRTELTGITASDLAGVTLSRKAATKRLAQLLTPNTVLVGHGLHHDLQALRLDHPWVIDTSMIFEVK